MVIMTSNIKVIGRGGGLGLFFRFMLISKSSLSLIKWFLQNEKMYFGIYRAFYTN